MTNKTLNNGVWPSLVSAEMVAGKTSRLSEPQINNNKTFWLESRPDEKGRNAIMMHDGTQSQCILPAPLSAKSRVHEYGGGSYLISDELLFFVLADDQQIYKANWQAQDFIPQALTHSPNLRFADLQLDTARQRLIAVCEDHSNDLHEPKNSLVAIDIHGAGPVIYLHQHNDFYSSPRISPNGQQCCWLSWNHPNMPWDNNQLWLTEMDDDGRFSSSREIDKEQYESLFQPQWAPNGNLFVVSDRDNWWNIYELQQETLVQISHLEGEFATPMWTFNMSTFGFISADIHTSTKVSPPHENPGFSIIATYTQNGSWKLCHINPATHSLTHLDVNSSDISGVYANQQQCVYIGASEISAGNIWSLHLTDITSTPPSFNAKEINPTIQTINHNDISVAQPIAFATGKGQSAHGLYYPPTSSNFHKDIPPPLIIICHGGPTGASSSQLDLKKQYWTNRGFAILDVNYRGSTGYGRNFRQLLHGNWGIYDVEDVIAAADYAIENGLAAADQCIIKGSSAGGYTVLAALAFSDRFDCGVSLYGIGDLETLACDTHKFEARYLDSLIGPYPEAKAIYHARSPIHAVDQIQCPMIVFQGLEDKVVPPSQAEAIIHAAKQKKLTVSYVTFANEGHGFRNSENIIKMLEEEEAFYRSIFPLSE